MELADLARLRCHRWRFVQLRIFRPISGYPRFPMGQSASFRLRISPADGWVVSSIWPTPALSRESLRLDLYGAGSAVVRVFQPRNLLRAETGAVVRSGSPHRPKGARLHLARSKRETGRSHRSALAQRRRSDLLSRPLVTAL